MANYIYYNNNPFGKTEPDCVTRAIALALDLDYRYVRRLLYRNAHKNGCDRLTKICYRQILEDKFGLVADNGNGRSVGEIADMYPNNRVIMRLDGHLLTSINGTIYDLFYNLDYPVDTYWVV